LLSIGFGVYFWACCTGPTWMLTTPAVNVPAFHRLIGLSGRAIVQTALAERQ
jgi:hypothetical protein